MKTNVEKMQCDFCGLMVDFNHSPSIIVEDGTMAFSPVGHPPHWTKVKIQKVHGQEEGSVLMDACERCSKPIKKLMGMRDSVEQLSFRFDKGG